MFKAWRLEQFQDVPRSLWQCWFACPLHRVLSGGFPSSIWAVGDTPDLHKAQILAAFLESQVCINPAVPEAGGDSSFNPGDACHKVGSGAEETQDVDFRTLGQFYHNLWPIHVWVRGAGLPDSQIDHKVLSHASNIRCTFFWTVIFFRVFCDLRAFARWLEAPSLPWSCLKTRWISFCMFCGRFGVFSCSSESPLQNRLWNTQNHLEFGIRNKHSGYLNWEALNFSRITSQKEVSATTVRSVHLCCSLKCSPGRL